MLQIKDKTIEKAKNAFEESVIEHQHKELERETEQKLAIELEKMQVNSKNYRPQVSFRYIYTLKIIQ